MVSKKDNPRVSKIVSQTDFAEDNLNTFETENTDVSIETLRKGNYPGSDLVIEQTLSPGSNYDRYIVSYKSEGLKIYVLLTVPQTEAPEGGFPAIVFNHGYIPPDQYQTTERYASYQDTFARAGFVTIKSDYRGHGNSEGEATGAYGSNVYTIDVLNAASSLKKYSKVNPSKIGMWGHSLGGFITLRAMVVSKDIKAGVIWAGVVGSYPDLINNWRRVTGTPFPLPSGARRWRQVLQERFGTPAENPAFWNSISANSYLSDISGPLQLHHGTADLSVPIRFSQIFDKQMRDAGKTAELYEYPGDDHNLANNFSLAAQRSVEFFDKYLK
ncbi:MAG: alpha/beta fold hydrolase [Patescibacteria group bacterium]